MQVWTNLRSTRRVNAVARLVDRSRPLVSFLALSYVVSLKAVFTKYKLKDTVISTRPYTQMMQSYTTAIDTSNFSASAVN